MGEVNNLNGMCGIPADISAIIGLVLVSTIIISAIIGFAYVLHILDVQHKEHIERCKKEPWRAHEWVP